MQIIWSELQRADTPGGPLLLGWILLERHAQRPRQLAEDLAAGDCLAALVLLYNLRSLIDNLHPPLSTCESLIKQEEENTALPQVMMTNPPP